MIANIKENIPLDNHITRALERHQKWDLSSSREITYAFTGQMHAELVDDELPFTFGEYHPLHPTDIGIINNEEEDYRAGVALAEKAIERVADIKVNDITEVNVENC